MRSGRGTRPAHGQTPCRLSRGCFSLRALSKLIRHGMGTAAQFNPPTATVGEDQHVKLQAVIVDLELTRGPQNAGVVVVQGQQRAHQSESLTFLQNWTINLMEESKPPLRRFVRRRLGTGLNHGVFKVLQVEAAGIQGRERIDQFVDGIAHGDEGMDSSRLGTDLKGPKWPLRPGWMHVRN